MYNKIITYALLFTISSVIGSENSKLVPLKTIIHRPNNVVNLNPDPSCPLTFFYDPQCKEGVICHTQGEFKINIVQHVTLTEEQQKTLSSKLLTTHKNLYFEVQDHRRDQYYRISVIQKLCAKSAQQLYDLSTTRI